MASRLTRDVQWLVVAHPQWWLGLMLLTLHGALAWWPGDGWARALLLAHAGLFLLWQPLWRGERRLGAGSALVLLLGGIGLLFISGWWLLTLWLAVLIGLVGGNLPGTSAPRQRFVYLIALLYLLSMLLLWAVPNLLVSEQMLPGVRMLVRYGLVVLPLMIPFIRVEMRHPEMSYAVDFFYGLMLFSLVAILVLGTFAEMTLGQDIYPAALAKTLLVIGGVLILLGWLWSPTGGTGGLGQLFSRYVLSVGLPFEQWLQNLAALAERESDPERFLIAALEGIRELPWVTGGEWHSDVDEGRFGDPARFRETFTFHDFTLSLFTRDRLSPALLLHVGLLARLLGYFYEAKRREQTLRQNAYTQAIYETGARLTHDVKNLLQSMKTLCVAAESSDAGQADKLQALMQRQLPQITQRLQNTLEKLQAPRQKVEGTGISAYQWWENLKARYVQQKVGFEGTVATDSDATLPAELFDSVAENFIQNALEKRKQDKAVEITVRFLAGATPTLIVCDTGHAMDAGIARRLFSEPVKSEWGLGVGLYQAGRQGRQLGYKLDVAKNVDGEVCLILQGQSIGKSG
jgi:hypothetical protein